MANFNLQAKLMKRKEVVHSYMPPDIVLLNLDSGYYFSTNEIGAKVWELCNGEKTALDIIGKIGELYQKNPEEIKADIILLLSSFEKEGLLEVGQ